MYVLERRVVVVPHHTLSHSTPYKKAYDACTRQEQEGEFARRLAGTAVPGAQVLPVATDDPDLCVTFEVRPAPAGCLATRTRAARTDLPR